MRYKAVALVVALQVLFFLGWAGYEQGVFDSGEAQYIRVRTVPVDPRDYLSGQYMVLAYEFSNSGTWNRDTNKREPAAFAGNIPFKEGQTVWVILRRDGEFYVPAGMQLIKPHNLAEGQVTFRGHYAGGRFIYGIEKYFFPEGTKEPDRKDVTVELKVASRGVAQVNRLFVNNEPWP